jgi:chromosome segregation ATPase
LEEIQNTNARNAIGAALDAAQASYEEIAQARDALNELESSGVYAENYLEQQRAQRAQRVRQNVEQRISNARARVDSASQSIEQELTTLGVVDPGRLAAAQSQISMLLGDIREDPEQLLVAYQQSFDVPEDRRAIEELVQRALRILPDTPQRGLFEGKWNQLREQLEERRPVEERDARRNLTELERAREYLGHVNQVTDAAIRGLTDPRSGGNLTAYAQAHVYEEELTGESAIKETLPTAARAEHTATSVQRGF